MGVTMRVASIRCPVTSLGPGVRVGVWTQGCSIGCPGCMSRHTWSADGGLELEVDAVVASVAALLDDHHASGVTISGGEPFEQPDALVALVDGLAAVCPDADVLVYSGFAAPTLRRRHPHLLERVDAVVAGPFVASLPSGDPMTGSSNQSLVAVSERWVARYSSVPGERRLRIGVDSGGLRLTGVPRRGDLDRLVTELAERGVVLEGLSW